jgi:hypothetical protein
MFDQEGPEVFWGSMVLTSPLLLLVEKALEEEVVHR